MIRKNIKINTGAISSLVQNCDNQVFSNEVETP